MKTEFMSNYELGLKEVIREIRMGGWMDRLQEQLFLVKEGYDPEEGQLIVPETFTFGYSTYEIQQTAHGGLEILVTTMNTEAESFHQSRITYQNGQFVVSCDSRVTTYTNLLNDNAAICEILLNGL